MFRKRSTVDVNPRLISAQRMKVQSARNQFFASSSLANDQNSSVMACHAFNHEHESLHRFAAEDSLAAGQIENDGLAIHYCGLSDALGGKCRSAE
jgi:hypothetical protein